jgi:hypothetical protein
MARIMVRRAGKGWGGQPIKRASGKCITLRPKTGVAKASGQKAAAKTHVKSRDPQILQINDRIPYYQRRSKPLVVKVKVKRNRPVHKIGKGEVTYPFGAGVIKKDQVIKNRKLKAHIVNKEEKVKYPTRGVTANKKRPDNQQLNPQPFNENEMIKCEICGVSVKPMNMARHLRRVCAKENIPEAAKPQPTPVRLSKKKLKSAGISSNSTRRTPNTGGNIVLISRRGTRIKDGQCAECKKRVQPCWKYAISNRGPVFLCGPCKPEVFERSFGFSETVDALDIASRGGGFETNRRRH